MPNSEKYVRGSRRVSRADYRAAGHGLERDCAEDVKRGLVLPALSDAERAAMRKAADIALSGPDGETINVMSYGEQVVELLGEYVDARIEYAFTRRGSGAEYANPDDMNKAGAALEKLLDRKVRVRA